jgi:multidrug resistance efflux pump
VRQAEASLVAAQAQLSLVREGARRQQKLQADAALRQAEAQMKTAEATYNRFKMLVDEGAVSRLRFDEVSLQLDVARAQHETARQQALLVHEGARSQELLQAEEAVRQAEAGVRQARQKEREAEAAVGAVAAQRDLTYEGARSQEVRQAEAQVRQAEEALRLAQAATGETQIKAENVRMLHAQVAQADAHLAAARVQLSYATLFAPFSGVVSRRHVDPGAMASPGVPLLTLVDPSGFRLEAVVPESRVKGLRLEDTAPVTIDALGRTLAARVSQIVPAADPASRTFVVKLRLPKDARLASGLFGRATLSTGERTGLFIPEAAVWRRESLTGVLVVEEGIAHKRLVSLGKGDGARVEVLSGVRADEVIVARDVGRIRDGERVEVGGPGR